MALFVQSVQIKTRMRGVLECVFEALEISVQIVHFCISNVSCSSLTSTGIRDDLDSVCKTLQKLNKKFDCFADKFGCQFCVISELLLGTPMMSLDSSDISTMTFSYFSLLKIDERGFDRF